jgi:hypothetical protein
MNKQKNKKPKYKLTVQIENIGSYEVRKYYKIQKRHWFWGWCDYTNPNINREYMETLCNELNELNNI